MSTSGAAAAPQARATITLGRGVRGYATALSSETFVDALLRYATVRQEILREERSLARHRNEAAELEARWPMLALTSVSLGQDRHLQGQIPSAAMAEMAGRAAVFNREEREDIQGEWNAQRAGEPIEPPAKRRREEEEEGEGSLPYDPADYTGPGPQPAAFGPRPASAFLRLNRAPATPKPAAAPAGPTKASKKREKEKKKAEEEKEKAIQAAREKWEAEKKKEEEEKKKAAEDSEGKED